MSCQWDEPGLMACAGHAYLILIFFIQLFNNNPNWEPHRLIIKIEAHNRDIT